MRFMLPLSLFMAAMVSLGGGVFSMHPAANSAESVQVIEMTAKKFEFVPSTIHVKQGTRVQLKITATDHVHGFAISELPGGVDTQGNPGLYFAPPQDCTRIEEGKTATIEFVAKTPGTYAFRCCVHCGWHHRAMKGELIVEP